MFNRWGANVTRNQQETRGKLLKLWSSVRNKPLRQARLTAEQFEAVQAIDADSVKREILAHEELFLKLAGELPKELIFQRDLLIARL